MVLVVLVVFVMKEEGLVVVVFLVVVVVSSRSSRGIARRAAPGARALQTSYETPTKTESDDDDEKAEGVRRAREGGDEEPGGRRERFLGPTLARAFAARASERLRADAEWRALGFKGADARGLRDKLIPALREAMRGDDGDEGAVDGSVTRGTTPDAVVIMCGINDAKRVVVGRTSANFRSELRQLVEEVRAVVGDECVVVLPATPIEAATLFPPPLVWVATRMNDLWDEQKAHEPRA